MLAPPSIATSARRFSRSSTPLVTHVVRSKPRWIAFGHPSAVVAANARAKGARSVPVRGSRGRTSGQQVVAIESRKQARIVAEQVRAQRRRKQRSVERPATAKGGIPTRGRKDPRMETGEGGGTQRKRWPNPWRCGGATETLGKIGRGAVGVAGSIARGAGVQTDLGSYIGQSVELETRASELSAAAYDEQRDKGKRIDPRERSSASRATWAKEAAFDPARVLEGLSRSSARRATSRQGKRRSWLGQACASHRHEPRGHGGSLRARRPRRLGDVGSRQRIRRRRQTRGWLWSTSCGSWLVRAKVARSNSKTWPSTAASCGCIKVVWRRCRAEPWRHGRLAQLVGGGGSAAGAAEAATAVAGFANTLKTRRASRNSRRTALTSLTRVADSSRSATSSKNRRHRGGRAWWAKCRWNSKDVANVKGAQAADPAFQAYVKGVSRGHDDEGQDQGGSGGQGSH